MFMADDVVRQSDRRTLYTKTLIKGALLELLKTRSFTSISVTMLSDTAGIGRNTFYRHFSNTFEALEAALDDAVDEMISVFRYIGIAPADQFSSYVVPFCQYIRSSERYRVVFTDEDLESLIIERILAFNSGAFVSKLVSERSFTEKQAEALIRFQAAGLLEICRTYRYSSDEEWAEILETLNNNQ